MAITSITRDLRWPFAGDVVTLTGICDTGDRVRFRLISTPPGSALEVWDAGKANYLLNNQVEPDVGGVYAIEGIEIRDDGDPPHFSNDLGSSSPAHPGVIAGTITETIIGSPTGYSLVVGDVLERTIGIEPDTVALRLATLTDWDYALVPTTWGVITRNADASKAPVLDTTASTDPARMAAQSAAVAQAVQDIGGYGDEYHRYGDAAYGETSMVIDWDDVVDSDPVSRLGELIWRLNDHISVANVNVHGKPDNTAVILTADATVGDAASHVALLNDILVRITAHAANFGGGFPVVHVVADSVVAAEVAGLAALAGGASLASRIGRTNTLWKIVDGHFGRLHVAPFTSATDTFVHYPPADFRLDNATYPKAVDETTAVARMNQIKVRYGQHRAKTAVYAGGLYHAQAGGAAELYYAAYPCDRESYVTALQEAWSVFRDHVGNRTHTTGATLAYHTEIDTTLTTLLAGSPTDFESAVRYHEALEWALGAHAAKGANVHVGVYPGGMLQNHYGVRGIHHAFRDSIMSSAGSTSVRENVATSKLILLNGFHKKTS